MFYLTIVSYLQTYTYITQKYVLAGSLTVTVICCKPMQTAQICVNASEWAPHDWLAELWHDTISCFLFRHATSCALGDRTLFCGASAAWVFAELARWSAVQVPVANRSKTVQRKNHMTTSWGENCPTLIGQMSDLFQVGCTWTRSKCSKPV